MPSASIKVLAGALAATLLSMPAGFANDSSAELGAGGLVLTRNDDIEMRSEDLYISAGQVRVNYVFFNRASRDVTIHVAFPMPDVTAARIPCRSRRKSPKTSCLPHHCERPAGRGEGRAESFCEQCGLHRASALAEHTARAASRIHRQGHRKAPASQMGRIGKTRDHRDHGI